MTTIEMCAFFSCLQGLVRFGAGIIIKGDFTLECSSASPTQHIHYSPTALPPLLVECRALCAFALASANFEHDIHMFLDVTLLESMLP